MRCRYNIPSDEAYRIDADGDASRAEVRLCEWPDMHPERLVDAPRWLLRLVGSGLSITPERDCVHCPGCRPTPPQGPQS